MGLKAKIAAIELCGDEVRLVAIAMKGRRPKVLEAYAARAAYDRDDQRRPALVKAAETVLGQMKSRPSACVLCVSSFYTVVRTLTIPFRGKRRVAAAVKFELEPYLAFPIEDLVVDFSPILEHEGQTEALVVGVRQALLEEQLGILREAGVDPEGISIDALGLTGLWQCGHGSAKGLHAVLHVRQDGAVLAVVCHKALAYFRHLSFTEEHFHADPEAALREVQNSMRGFHAGWRGEGRIESIGITGDGFFEDERDLFQQEMGIPVTFESLSEYAVGTNLRAIVPSVVEIAAAVPPASVEAPEPALPDETPGPTATAEPEDALQSLARSQEALDGTAFALEEGTGSAAAPAPFESIVPDPASAPGLVPPASNRWEAAIGVAMGAAGQGFSMNFRKGPLAYRNTLQGLAPQIMVASCIALAFLLGVALYFRILHSRDLAETVRVQSEIDNLEKEVLELQEQGVDVSSNTFGDPTLLDVLSEISAKMPESSVHILDIQIERPESNQPWIVIYGEIKDDAQFGAVYADLKKAANFEVADEPELKLEEGRSTFKITAERKTPSASE